MSTRRGFPSCVRAALLSALALLPPSAPAATITGTVIGEGARPIAGATVQVVGAPRCAATTGADGTFSLSCPVTGRHTLRASFGDLRPWELTDVELAPEIELHTNFLLEAVGTPTTPQPDEGAGFFARPLPNPVVGSWQGTEISMRMLATAVAPVAFVLGGLTMMSLGRRFGVHTHPLSATAVGELVMNPQQPNVGERVTPLATVGARGTEATVSFGADEIAQALAGGRHGLVFTSLVVAPGLFVVASAAFAYALLVGQESWLFYAMLLVPGGFVLTPAVIAAQALSKHRSR